MINGEDAAEFEEDTIVADNNAMIKTDRYITKPRRSKNKKDLYDQFAPRCPSYLRRKSLPGQFPGPERRRRGGEYSLSPAPRPSFTGHEELRPRSRARASSQPRRYKLPQTPPPRPRKLPRDPSQPRALPPTPKVVKKDFVRYKQISISTK